MKSKNTSGFGVVGVLAVVMIVGLIGFSGWLVYDRQRNKDVDIVDTKQDDKKASTSLTTTTVKSVLNPGTTVTLKHPSGWTVSNTTEDYDSSGTKAVRAYIKSDKGHYLHIRDNGGVGGDCEPNAETFTLVKRIATQSSNYYFAEYKYNANSSTRYLSLENHKDGQAWTTLKEGQTGTDTCSNMPQYSFAGDLYVSIASSDKSSLASSVSYTDLQQDTDFLTMLQSLTVSE